MKTHHRAPLFFGAAILLSVIGTVASFWAFRQTEAAAETRQAMRLVISDATDVLSELKDAETGQRGYLLTGNAAFLAPYSAVRDGIPGHVAALRRLAAGKPGAGHLDALAPLVDAKLAELAHLVALRSEKADASVRVEPDIGRGKQLMDAIRHEIAAFLQAQEGAFVAQEALFQAELARLLAAIVLSSLFTIALGSGGIWLIFRERKRRLESELHAETARLLVAQEATNERLRLANTALQVSEEKLSVTLNSIGDAVLTTDADAHVTLLNPLAEKLTGWTQAEAVGRPVDEIFHIINKESRALSTIPVTATLAQGTIQGLANHTVLIARDGGERDIAHSCAPIRDRDGTVVGAVLVFRNVTEDYAVQQALRDSSALIQTILNTVVDGIITIHAVGGVIEKVNPAAERMFGYAAAELLGQSFSILIPELDGDQRAGSLAYYSASAESRSIGLGREVVGRRKDGSGFPVEIAASEMWLGGQRYFSGVLRDITARKQAEATLLQAGALQSAIFNSANFSSIATDAQGVIQIFNVGAERMLGYAAADVMNQITPADISDPQEVIARAAALSLELGTPITPGFEALVFKASRGIEDIYELTYIRKDGSRFPAVVSVTALRDAQNVIIGYLLIGTDNTARKQIEAERQSLDERLRDSLLALQEKHVELGRSKAAADKANLAKSDFLSSMSHELRSPLNAILGFAQFMESDSPPPSASAKASIDQILHAGWYLLKLINEILDLAVIESGRVSLSPEPVSLAAVLHECQTMIEPQAARNGIRMTFPRFDTPVFVDVDRTRLKQVIINLLSNAIKYNKVQGLVTVTCEITAAGAVRIAVADTGAGLTAENVAQLFEAFNRLGQEHGQVEGTGIGLMVSKQLVELMGGTIGAESDVGRGSVFWIEFRECQAPEVDDEEDQPLAEVRNTQSDEAPVHTLLYVEDNPANLTLVERLIARRPDLKLLTATDAVQGIAIARSALPDLILMDINLPGISGVQALKILQDDGLTRQIPVIALSANALPYDIEKGLAAGFFRYLTKPIRVPEFMSTLTDALEFGADRHRVTLGETQGKPATAPLEIS